MRADVYGDEQPAALVRQIEPTLADVRAQLPGGYLLEVGGTVEDSERGQRSVNAGLPLFIIVVMTLLMAQLKSFALGHGLSPRRWASSVLHCSCCCSASRSASWRCSVPSRCRE